MNERLKLIRSSLGLSQKDFSQKINIGQSTLAMLESGQRIMKDIHISQICSEFNVSEDWLRYGTGEMFLENDKTILDSLEYEYNLDSLDREILELYLKLSPSERKTIKQFALSMGKLASKSIEKELDVEKKQNPMTENQTEELDEEARKELELYKMELLDEKKGKISLVSEKQKEKLG